MACTALDGADLIGVPASVVVPPRLRVRADLITGHGGVRTAVLRWSAWGLAEAFVNGERAGGEMLVPGWSAYQDRLRWAQADVTAQLVGRTEVVVGLQLADGWYRGRIGWQGLRELYGDRLGAVARLEVDFDDGSVQTVATDRAWRWCLGPVRAADLYDGQIVDARLADDWLAPGFDDSTWAPVSVLGPPPSQLVARLGPPVRRLGTVRPRTVTVSPSGETIVDFGENLVGWLRLEVAGEAGSTVTVRHAEVLQDGELAVRPLRSARATDTFVLSGRTDVLEPSLTLHGFRYAGLRGWPARTAVADGVRAVVVGSDLSRTGWFECSDTMLTRLHANVVRSARGNFVSLPTDCPQRDERLGWTGDISVFAPTAAFLFDVEDFLRDWLADVAAEQCRTGGRVPFVVPDVLGRMTDERTRQSLPPSTTAIWGDAAVWVPWSLWRAYGNLSTLAECYPSMRAHGLAVRSSLSSNGLWDTGFQFADWLDPDAPPDDPGAAKADPGVVATACAVRTFDILGRVAALLTEPADAARFAALAASTRRAFRTAYVREGVVHSDCATVYALAIAFDLLGAADRQRAGTRLAELVRAAGHRISTGFAGTPFVLDALTDTGHVETALALLDQRDCPSWLYPVTRGATTIWERWDSLLPDGTLNPGEMTSFNHYALGAVADWMHRRIGGLAPGKAGYRTLHVAPVMGGTAPSAAGARLATRRGPAGVTWSTRDRWWLEVDVPPGATACVELPWLGRPTTVGAGRHRFERPDRVSDRP